MIYQRMFMKKLTLIILTLFPLGLFGQVKAGKIEMTTEFGSENQELQDLLTFENIDHYKVRFKGKDLKGKHFSVAVKTLWDGRITRIDTIINTAKEMPPIQTDTLTFKVTAKKNALNSLKVLFRFPLFGNERLYEASDSYDYSLRDIGTKMDIEVGKAFPAFAYILPYEKDGWKMWCAVDSSGKEVENWGKEFGIKHYLIFEMKFE